MRDKVYISEFYKNCAEIADSLYIALEIIKGAKPSSELIKIAVELQKINEKMKSLSAAHLESHRETNEQLKKLLDVFEQKSK